jgi:hypothetical protein
VHEEVKYSRIVSLLSITLLAIALLAVPIVAPEDNLIPLQGTVSGGTPTNLTVAIYDAPTAGNEIYNSTTDFGITTDSADNGALNVSSGGSVIGTQTRLVGQAGAPSAPLDGVLYYDTTQDALCFYNSTAWESINGDGLDCT